VHATATVEGQFALVEGGTISLEQLTENSFDLARLLFPVARAEIARLLTQARMNDIPLPWDLPREVVSPSDVQVGQS
jgi:hypothetical protein